MAAFPAQRGPADVLVVLPAVQAIPVGYYAAGAPILALPLQDQADGTSGSPTADGAANASRRDTPPDYARLLGGARRAWIVGLVVFNHMFPTEEVKLPD